MIDWCGGQMADTSFCLGILETDISGVLNLVWVYMILNMFLKSTNHFNKCTLC